MASSTKPKSVYDLYRLRMIFNQWYIILYTDDGKLELKRLGPFNWVEAQAKADEIEKNVQDWDKL